MLSNILAEPSPVWEHEGLSIKLEVDLKVKRDDLLPFWGGGNKVRKMVLIAEEAMRRNANAIVTAGGANSNHLRVFALASAYLGWHCSAVVHSERRPELELNANLQLVDLSGADVNYCTLSEAPKIMDLEMERLRNEGHKPFYVWGGGHTAEGVRSYVKAVEELKGQMENWEPDYIVVASGTGGTQAGLHIGAAECYDSTDVIGVSVARKQERGMKGVSDAIELYFSKYESLDSSEIRFLDNYTGGGYEKTYPELSEVIRECADEYGLVLDPVYTGKAFVGLIDLAEKGVIEKGARVLFWHTGGLFNLFPTSKL